MESCLPPVALLWGLCSQKDRPGRSACGTAPGKLRRAATAKWSCYHKEAAVRILEIDTPERGWRAKCDAEAELAEQATAAAVELLSGTVQLAIEGRDNFGRILAHVELPDGRDYGTEMIARGLALPYAGRERGWCG